MAYTDMPDRLFRQQSGVTIFLRLTNIPRNSDIARKKVSNTYTCIDVA
jgi:hypothetical protein